MLGLQAKGVGAVFGLSGRGSLAWVVQLHTLADLAVALVLLLALASLLGLGFGLAEHGQIDASAEPDLGLPATILNAVRHPWEVTGGLWFSLMLASTLLPTTIHLLFLVASPLALVQAGKQRRAGLRERLLPLSWDALDVEARQGLATELSAELVQRNALVWVPAAGLLVLVVGLLAMGVGALFGLAWFAESVGSFACWGVDVADWLFSHERALGCHVWGRSGGG